jgi:hypothetical protein
MLLACCTVGLNSHHSAVCPGGKPGDHLAGLKWRCDVYLSSIHQRRRVRGRKMMMMTAMMVAMGTVRVTSAVMAVWTVRMITK